MGAACTRMDDRYGVLRRPTELEVIPEPDFKGKVVNGYKIEGLLEGGRECRLRGSVVTFKCTKNMRTYAMKGFLDKNISESDVAMLMGVGAEHENIHSVKDAFVCGVSTYIVTEYLSVYDNVMSESMAPAVVVSILNAVRFLESHLGRDTSLNIKPTNLLLSADCKPIMLDWYVPTVLQTSQSKLDDRQGLGEWLHNSMSAHSPPVGMPSLDAYKSFIKELTTTDENISSHRWLALARPTPLLSLQTNYRNKNEIDSSVLATCKETKLQLLLWAKLWNSYTGYNTDRYLNRSAIKTFRKSAQACLEATGWKITKTTLEEIGEQSTEGTSLLLSSPTSVKRADVEGIWFTDRGTNPVNQDAVFAIPDISALYGGVPGNDYGAAVFDGHGGVEAADYCAQHLVAAIRSSPSYDKDVSQAIRDGYAKTNNRFLKLAEEHKLDCGTTASVAIVKDNQRVFIGCAGDTTVVACIGENCQVITQNHRASVASEKAAVEARGGCVMTIMGSDRVQGLLQVTRSIGDVPCQQYITCEPDVFDLPITPEFEFLIIASDGLWDVMPPSEVVKYVRECKQEIDASYEKHTTVSFAGTQLRFV